MNIIKTIKQLAIAKALMRKIKNSSAYFWCHEYALYKERFFPRHNSFGGFGSNAFIEYPVYFDTPGNVFIEENVKIRTLARVINSPKERVFIKKYTVVGSDCTIIPGNHRKTIGIPQFLLGTSHINDNSHDLTIHEDVWIGAQVTILSNASIGRGCIVGARSLVTHEIPPYCVVLGQPARIVGKVFELEDILRHEEALYPPEQRLSRNQLKDIFERNGYDQLKTYGCTQKTTPEQNNILNQLKKDWKYVEPEHLKNIHA